MAIETELSDCHKMTVTVLNMCIKKKPRRCVNYRCYKNFKHDLLYYFEAFNEATMNYENIPEKRYQKP